MNYHDEPPPYEKNKSEKNESLPSKPIEDLGDRGGDDMTGRPKQIQRTTRYSHITLQDIWEQNEKEEALRIESEVLFKPVEFSFLWMKGLLLMILLFVGLAGWFLLSHIIVVVQTILALPTILQILGWLVVLFLTAVVVYPLWYLLQRYRELSVVRQINIVSVRAHGSQAHYKKAREELMQYIEQYDIDDPDQQKQLKRIGVDIAEIRRAKNLLLEEGPSESQAWIKEFQTRFQQPLDQAAEKTIHHYARMAALKAALSPNPLLDMFALFYNGFSMLNDLCTLYHVRTSKFGLLYLLGLVVFQGYLAGEMEENSEQIIAEKMPELLGGGLLGSIGKFAGAATAQAGIHFIFLRRIGRIMQLRLKPIK